MEDRGEPRSSQVKEKKMYLPRLRRLHDTLKEIKKVDPDTCLTYYMLRQLIAEGQLTELKYTNAFVLNLDEVYHLFGTPIKTDGCTKEENNEI